MPDDKATTGTEGTKEDKKTPTDDKQYGVNLGQSPPPTEKYLTERDYSIRELYKNHTEGMSDIEKANFYYMITGALDRINKARAANPNDPKLQMTDEEIFRQTKELYDGRIKTADETKDTSDDKKSGEQTDKPKSSPQGKMEAGMTVAGTDIKTEFDPDTDAPLADDENYFSWREKRHLGSMNIIQKEQRD